MKDKILNGILWTAMRSMMSSTDNPKERINAIKSIAHNLTTDARTHLAEDIRRNIDWNKDFPWANDKNLIVMWYALVKWLDECGVDKTPRYCAKTEPLPKDSISDTWFMFIKHSLDYIVHRHTYAASYADDIASYIPIMTGEQRQALHEWLNANVQHDDDTSVRMLAAALDPDNRYAISAKATAEQIRQWAKDYNVTICSAPTDIEHTDEPSFLFDGGYHPLTEYYRHGEHTGAFIHQFITDIRKI